MRVFRIAPSPTGRLHFGHTKPYLLNYALARANQGKFILRIEDTDQKRNNMDTVKDIIADLHWLGIDYDEGPDGSEPNEFFQSQRLARYQECVQKLLADGKAYKAYETPEERATQIAEQRQKGKAPVYSGAHADLTPEEQEAFEKEGRKPVVRLRVPKDKIIEFEDKIYGKVKTSTNVIGDIVIQKSDGFPMYNFAVVIDDHDMEVTDVVRGFGHLSNTPKQILVYEAFGWNVPIFAHFSDILNENGQGKLSKRKGAKAITQYKAEGYLPDAIFNYVTVISCSFAFQNKDQEIMKRDEIYSKISYEKIIKTNARFNSQKLDWMNGQHIRLLDPIEFETRCHEWLENYAQLLPDFYPQISTQLLHEFVSDFDRVKSGLPLIQARITKFKDIIDQLRFFYIQPVPGEVDITPTKHTTEEFEKVSKDLYNIVTSIQEPWHHEDWEAAIRELADKHEWKHADVFMALRLLIVGDRFSPPLFESMQILGKDECLSRMRKFIVV